MIERYVAFIEYGECTGFCSLTDWPKMQEIDPDIKHTVEFEGPSNGDPGAIDDYFEALKGLADAAVVRELQSVPN